MKKIYSNSLLTAFILLIGYGGVCAFFYGIQEEIIFHPTKLDREHQYRYSFPFEERFFKVADNAQVHAIHAFADSGRGLVFYLPGNARSNNTNPGRFMLFLSNGYDVLYPDYRGFGKSTGELENQEDLVGDMKIIYNEMLKEYPEDSVVIVGYSLGAGVAAQLAASTDPARLILWTPFYSMLDMKDASYSFLPDFLIKYPLRTDLALQEIEEPVTIFYAGEDETLPVDRALPLTKFLKEGDYYYVLKGQRHGGVYRNRELMKKMNEILN